MSQEKGIKFDEGKRDWVLVPWDVMEEVVQVLEHGAKKYKPDNWKYVRPVSRYLNPIFRHVTAYMNGEKNDPDTGKSHLASVICNCLFAMWHEKHPEPDPEVV